MSQFHHRDWHNSIAVGSYLYIDGGEIATWNGSGEGLLSIYYYHNATGDINVVPESHTRSIDLSTSWTNQTVTLFAIDKDAPVVCGEALWPDANGKLFYAYDGGFSNQYRDKKPDYSNQLWQFSPSGSAGVWSLVSPSTDSGFSSLSRLIFGSYASGAAAGFALGGGSDYATGALSNELILAPGLVVFNTTSQQWSNITSDGYSPTDKVYNGAGHFVSLFGPNGLLLFMGGAIDEEGDLATFDTVSIYDPTSQQWATQSVSGDLPNPCTEPCVVGAAGDNGTYEVFLYGGDASQNTTASVEQGAVHVLTLPAFQWLKQSEAPTSGRSRHSCNVIGNRQMVVVGGFPITLAAGVDYIPPDPWPNGIGVFDMSAMEWASQYDANAAPYVSPDIVKEYYQKNPRYPLWSSSEIEQWFTRKRKDTEDTTSSTTPSTHHSSDTNVGAIAGGTVGGVLSLLAVGLIVWFFRRRKRAGRHGNSSAVTEKGDSDNAATAELNSDNPSHRILDSTARHELRTKERPGEASSTPIYEMPHDTSR